MQIKLPFPTSQNASSNLNGSPRTPVTPSKVGQECEPEFEATGGFREWRRLSNGKIFIGLDPPRTKKQRFAKQTWQGGKKSLVCAPAARSRSRKGRKSLKGRKSTRKTRKN